MPDQDDSPPEEEFVSKGLRIVASDDDEEEKSEDRPARREKTRPSNYKLIDRSEVAVGASEAMKPVEDWQRDRSEVEATAKKKGPTPWALLAFVLLPFMVLVGGAVWYKSISFEQKKPTPKRTTSATTTSRSSNLVGSSQRLSEEDLKPTAEEREEAQRHFAEMTSVATRFLAATKPADFRGIIRQEEKWMPVIEEYYRTRPFKPKKFIEFGTVQPGALDGYSLIITSVVIEEGDVVKKTSLLFENTDNDFLIDWAAVNAYQPMNLEKFIEDRPASPVDFRVYVDNDNFYDLEYPEEEYQSYRITFRDTGERLYGWTKRGTKEAAELSKAREQIPGKLAMILRVKFRPDTRGRRSVLITDVVSTQWADFSRPK